MTAHDTSPRNSRFVTALFLVVLVGSVFLMVRLLAVYLAAIIMAGVLVSLFAVPFSRLNALLGGRRQIAAVIMALVIALLVMLPIVLVLVSLSFEVVAVYERAARSETTFIGKALELVQENSALMLRLEQLGQQFGVDLSAGAIRGHAATAATRLAAAVYDQVSGVATNILRLVLNFGLMVVVIFALYSEGPALKAYLLDLSPLPDEQEEELVGQFKSISRAVFLGNGMASMLQGVMGGVGFYAWGLGSGVLWGSAMAFFAFLPIVGAALVYVPAGLVLGFEAGWGTALGFLLYNAAYVAVLEYGLKPRLIGGHSSMNGVLVFIGILAGLKLYGILGLFYGPLIITIFLSVAEIYKIEYRRDLMAMRSPWFRADVGAALTEVPRALPIETEPSLSPPAPVKALPVESAPSLGTTPASPPAPDSGPTTEQSSSISETDLALDKEV